MKTMTIERYECEICGHSYATKAAARKCESRSVLQDKGAKIGDMVLITAGDGKGSKAIVDSRRIVDMEWGHYRWDRYWHTVMLTAKIVDGWGSRQLTFDDYELVTP